MQHPSNDGATVAAAAANKEDNNKEDNNKEDNNKAQWALVVHSHADQHVDRLTLPFRLFNVRGNTIKIHQEHKSDGSGGTCIGYGAAVYPSSIVMAHYLEHHGRLCNTTTLLEVGGGHGFSGIAAAVCGVRSVVTTDGDDISIQLTERNIVENNVSTNCHATKLLWGNRDHEDIVMGIFGNRKPDIIIGSDVTACPYADALPKLMETLLYLSGPETTIILSFKSRNVDEESFWQKAATIFNISNRDRVIHPDFVNDSSLHLSILRRKKM